MRGVQHPIRLVEQDLVDLETTQVDRLGTSVRVTSIERTLVDMLDRQELSGGIEEIWRNAQQLGWLDDRRVLSYVHARRSAVLAARVGYLLEQLPELRVPTEALAELRDIATTLSPGPFDFAPHERGDHQYLHAWRLRVPVRVFERAWEEPFT
jgi:predicted transcriptional regulator of viral defense system